MTRRLASLAEALGPVLAGLEPAAPVKLPPLDAVGLILAAPLHASGPVPAAATALRRGLAVRSLDLVGASPHAPALLAARPPMVRAGEALPPGCDAVLDPDAVTDHGGWMEAVEAPAPGWQARLAGHDLAAGAVLAPAGAWLTPELGLAACLAGIAEVAARRAVVAVEIADPALRTWLELRLAGLGCVMRAATGSGPPALILRAASDGAPRLALQPGETAWIAREGEAAAIDLPARFDGAVSAFCALALPVLARLTGEAPRPVSARLAGKLTSAIGLTELALFRLEADMAVPLASGDVTLAALAAADAFCLTPPEAEGFAAGASLDLIRFSSLTARPGQP